MTKQALSDKEIDAILRCIDYSLSSCITKGEISVDEANNTTERIVFNKLLPFATEETKRNFGV